jgi:hypothetical protein
MLTLNTLMLLNQPFISAASGLIKIDQRIFVIADDENFLGLYDLKNQTGLCCELFAGRLPEDKQQRKKVKPDLECILLVPDAQSLLLIPSGSTTHRDRGAVIDLQGKLKEEISFSFLYNQLRHQLPELNIEGALIHEQALYLFQRGNGKLGQNALIKIGWLDFLQSNSQELIITPIGLDTLAKVKLTFTDATNFGKNFLYLAVAEDSDSVYQDGVVSGSVLGILSPEGIVLAQIRLLLSSKPEGLSFCEDSWSFYIVTDDDDRLQPAKLLLGELPLEWKSFLL